MRRPVCQLSTALTANYLSHVNALILRQGREDVLISTTATAQTFTSHLCAPK
jgi:hypothetical protein